MFSNIVLAFKDMKIQMSLITFSEWDWDVFKFAELCDGKPLVYAMNHVFQRFNIDRMIALNFFRAIESSYLDVPYHNCIHGVDVMQATHWLLSTKSAAGMINDTDLFSALIAAVAHDVAHPGTNNAFEISRRSDLATIYNDRSVLENFHVSTIFRLLKKQENDIMANFSSSMYREVRETIIEMILATDMAFHTRQVAHIKSVAESKRSSKLGFTKDDRLLALTSAIHCADLSTAARPLHVSKKWVFSVYEEFFKQGDREKELGLPISPLCDRRKPNIEKGQIGFISFVTLPLYHAWAECSTEVKSCILRIEENLKYWKEQAAAASPRSPPA